MCRRDQTILWYMANENSLGCRVTAISGNIREIGVFLKGSMGSETAIEIHNPWDEIENKEHGSWQAT